MNKASKNGDRTLVSKPQIRIGKISDYRPQAQNANKHTERGLRMLDDSMSEDGYVAPMTAVADGEVIDGSARLERAFDRFSDEAIILEHDGTRPIITKRIDIPDAASPIARRIALRANRIAEADLSWDASILAELAEVDPNTVKGMFSDKELAEILSQAAVEPKDAEPQIDRAAELQQKWGTETGQLWVIGNHRLLVGDATNKADVGRLLAGNKPDEVMTDPPYGIGVDKSMHEKGGQQYGKAAAPKKHYAATDWDSCQPPDETIKWLVSCAPQVVIWGGNYFHLPPARCYLVWDKQNDGNQFADCELAWTNLDKPVRLIRHLWNGMLRADKEERLSHPTQKPLDVIMWAIKQLDDVPSTILDTYCGVGTTVVAAENLGRQCLALDIAPEYVACSLERMATAFPHLKIEKADQARAVA